MALVRLLLTYDIRLVVVLRVVLEDLGALLVVERSDEVVNTTLELFPPVLALREPETLC